MPNSHSRNSSTGKDKLTQDIAKLLNNCHGSDIQFKVGGGVTDKNLQSTGETILDTSTAVTLYAHTAILRCRSRHFAAMFENDKEWRESSGGVVYKSNMSLPVFYKVLEYIYTGDMNVQTDILFEMITAAEEMELEELSIECQINIIKLLKQAVLNEKSYIDGYKSSDNETEESHYQSLSISVAVRNFLIPALIFAHNNTMSDFFSQLFEFTVGHIGVILTSADTRTAFVEIIPPLIFIQILASDSLKMQEYDVWKLALRYACHKTNILESAVEAYFKLKNKHKTEFQEVSSEDENTKSQVLLSDEQLKRLKTNLTPLLLAIRFSLIEGYQFSCIVDILIYLLSSHRLIELQRFHAQSEKSQPFDLPRLYGRQESLLNTKEPDAYLKKLSKIIDKMESWQQMKLWIFESSGLEEFHSARDVKFNLLFRASEHGFLAMAFHKHCDYKGPTIVIIKSDDGHVFGGVNFADWKSKTCWSGSTSNFVFALADGLHRKTPVNFLYWSKGDTLYAARNHADYGPIFGYRGVSVLEADIIIGNEPNTSLSFSTLPHSYNGVGASSFALAGKKAFLVAEYEVFAISKS